MGSDRRTARTPLLLRRQLTLQPRHLRLVRRRGLLLRLHRPLVHARLPLLLRPASKGARVSRAARHAWRGCGRRACRGFGLWAAHEKAATSFVVSSVAAFTISRRTRATCDRRVSGLAARAHVHAHTYRHARRSRSHRRNSHRRHCCRSLHPLPPRYAHSTHYNAPHLPGKFGGRLRRRLLARRRRPGRHLLLDALGDPHAVARALQRLQLLLASLETRVRLPKPRAARSCQHSATSAA